MKSIHSMSLALLSFCLSNPLQASRPSVSFTEVNGTFLYQYTGIFKGFSSKLTVKALGNGKLTIDFDLIHPYVLNNNELSANMGTLSGEANIIGDTATYQSDEYGSCKIVMVFTKPGDVKVTQEGSDAACGFGHGVYADGTYYKTK